MAASSENSTIAVGTSKKTSSTPSMIMPPAMPNTPETSEATNTAVPITASETSDMPPYPCQNSQPARTEIDAADGEDDDARPLPEAVVGHALDHIGRERGAADRERDRADSGQNPIASPIEPNETK